MNNYETIKHRREEVNYYEKTKYQREKVIYLGITI